jgi:hypothetical protein
MTMLADSNAFDASAHGRRAALKSWDNTRNRSARTLPGRLAWARKLLATHEAQACLTDASAPADGGQT